MFIFALLNLMVSLVVRFYLVLIAALQQPLWLLFRRRDSTILGKGSSCAPADGAGG
ncbi:hypothetical protein K439DRAFT_1632926 [Ramaria rubella]|nr:hypothetical protein K439DRAFT_1632926 [Ramaria rubella]